MYYHSSEKLDRMYEQSKIGVIPVGSDVRAMIAELREHRTARWGIDSCLPRGKASDNAAVDRFARAMKAKLALAREKGRGGWDDPEQCSPDVLSRMLHDHVAKGDPVDVANFAMMIEHYGASISPDASPDSGEAQLVTVADYNAVFDPADEAGGDAFRAGFREGWLFAQAPDGEGYDELAESYGRAVDIEPSEAWSGYRETFFAALPLAALPVIGSPFPSPAIVKEAGEVERENEAHVRGRCLHR